MADANAIDLLLRPLNAATSKSAWRAYLSAVLFVLTSVVLLAVAFLSYGVFYTTYVPQVNVQRVVHLQFGQGHPHGVAPLDDTLVSKQAYDVIVHLDLPRSPPNIAAGNFMVDFKLLARLPPASNGSLDDSDVLVRSRRPTLLTYNSPFVNWVLVTASVPWILLGWRREDEQLHVPVLEELTLSPGSRTMPKALRLELEADQKLMVYKAHVEFVARFSGLRGMMYNHRIISLVVFSVMFYFTSLVSAVGAWTLFWTYFPSRPTGEDIRAPSAATDSEVVFADSSRRRESDPESPALSDTPRVFPTLSGARRLQYLPTPRATPDLDEGEVIRSTESHPPVEADDEGETTGDAHGGRRLDSGIGTSMEDEPANTTQRRRNWRNGTSNSR
ncbi:MAG: hypothetical protein M1815_001329 [Lichina confinis]|nr:MAG: hypothetical protein M1815_001329 [Lichina confinis]